MERIFVKSANWVGDAVMSTPTLRVLRRTFPLAQITVLARPNPAAVFEANPDIDRLWVTDESRSPLAFVRAVWDIPPFGQMTRHHGSQVSLRYTGSSVAILGSDGGVLEERPLPTNFLAEEMTRFAAEMSEGRRHEVFEADINRHVAISALLEAVYLSARTGQPETTRRLFEAQKWPEPKR